ncbi:MAG: crossover junction endodeoxyribonuclease RuvC [Clostridia bacterium]|nr:crossover junction endodeoxyribonuclease RuvC [Clostridia bacterium]
MIILGIDPGYAITGYGVLEHVGNKFRIIAFGDISTAKEIPFSNRLLTIYNEINKLIITHHVDAVAVEELFFNTNTKTAIKVGHGRGIALLCGALNEKKVFEYTPLQVKQAVCGYGRADKKQVQQMVKVLLNLSEVPKPDDVADALAIAICHAHSYNERFDKGI